MPYNDSVRVRAGQFAQAARQGAIILIALALPRLGVDTESIGQWEKLLYLGYVLGFGWLTGLLQGYLVHVGVSKSALRFSRYAMGGIGLISASVLFVAALGHEWVFAALQIRGVPAGWYYFFLFLLARWPGFCFEQILLTAGKVRELIAFATLSSLGFLLSFLLPFYLGYGLPEALLWLGVFSGAKGLFLAGWTVLGGLAGAGKVPESMASYRAWWHGSWPLITYASAGSIVTAFDPWFVNYWYGGDPEVFAIFRYGVRELPWMPALVNGLIMVAIPLVARERKSGLAALRKLAVRLYHPIFGGALLLMLTADWWWTIVFTDAFAASIPIFRVYLLVVGCRVVFAMSVLTALEHTRHLYLFSLLELAVNIVLSWWLASHFGLIGIVWATVAASYFHEFTLAGYLRWRVGVGYGEYAGPGWYWGYVGVLWVVCLSLEFMRT